MVQAVKIGEVSGDVTVNMQQNFAVSDRQEGHLLDRIVSIYIRQGGKCQEWLELCQAVYLTEAIRHYGSQTEAAKHIGLTRNHISLRLKALGLRK